ncbi:MAG: hypothetical protein ABL985_02315 [Casimicrobium sp.]
MASKIVELFGYAPTDVSVQAKEARAQCLCPFVSDGLAPCTKEIGDRSNRIKSGVCSIRDKDGHPVLVCPIRMYANQYRLLKDVATLAFKTPDIELINGSKTVEHQPQPDKTLVAVFGKGWGGELRLPGRPLADDASGRRIGSVFVDWILARLDSCKKLVEFAALEVQTMDTIGSYREERTAHLNGKPFAGKSASPNWANVNKRILPQLIYKGHLLEREALCNSGLFFACPEPVYKHILSVLGNDLAAYPIKNSSLTFCTYDLGLVTDGQPRELLSSTTKTTTVQQVQIAFSSPKGLPEAGAYEKAIREALSQ